MKTICIYHSRDLDGWMSAGIVKHWFTKDNEEYTIDDGEVFIGGIKKDLPHLDFLGWDYGDDIPNLEDYDKVIMCDISFPKDHMDAIAADFDSFVWLDHHKSAIDENEDIHWVDGVRDTKYSACELTWMYFFPNDDMPEIVRLLGRYDCFGHKGTDEEQKVLEFQYGARQVISNYEEAYNWLYRELNEAVDIIAQDTVLFTIWDKGEAIYKYLCTEAKQTYAKAFPVEFKVDEDENTSWKYNFLCVNQERFNPINFGIDYHKDEWYAPVEEGTTFIKGFDGFACFWYKDGMWKFSLYNDNDEVDCSVIAKQYGGGGHKGAAGFIIDDINKIIK